MRPEMGGRPSARSFHIDWGRLRILDVWRDLGGGELRGNRGRAFWRDGDGYNVSIDPDRQVWYDHARAEGGGFLELAAVALGSKAAAVQWIAVMYGEALDPTEAQKVGQELAQRRQIAEYARLWRAANIRTTENIKADTCVMINARVGEERDRAWFLFTQAARELWRFEQLHSDALHDAFVSAVANDPEYVARLIHEQRGHEGEAKGLACFIVACLAHEQRGANAA
ncbi:MAG: hypothetical protein HY820_23390 [Acidobacteria bacterium]|nr:hypothetical protein [Acidobacteriota bacterium]